MNLKSNFTQFFTYSRTNYFAKSISLVIIQKISDKSEQTHGRMEEN